ncbi:MAG: hypothetical protein QG620_758 [Patescibacteria group bacterium]|nr:hypothetical protein [Patescibacteria group bacterium]
MFKKIVLWVFFVSAVLAATYFWDKNKNITDNQDAGISGIVIQDSESNFLAGTSNEASGAFSQKELIVPDKYKAGAFAVSRKLNLPDGVTVSVFAAGLGSARAMAFSGEGNIFVTDLSGKVLLLRDADKDGAAEEIITVDQNLQNPHGVELFENNLYVGEEHQVVAYRNINEEGKYQSKEILITNLPSGAGHATRTVKIGPDRKIYVHVGSSCNVCEETDERRATILRYNLDGSFDRIIGAGLRNTVGFTFKNTSTGFELWAVDNGRDRIGDNIPPEEANLVYVSGQEETKNFGWPYCYGRGIANPEYPGRADYCQNQTEFPRYEMQAHSAPLGVAFAPDNFSKELSGDMIISFHGSWNRSEPTGYKVVRIDPDGSGGQAEDFITGWRDANGQVWGRPVDVKFSAEGDLFISDDLAGAVYRIRSKK